MRHPNQSLAGEAGQTFVEWLGAMAFVVVLVTLLVAAAPGVADAIINFLTDALKAITP